jgi:DNA repair protein RadD
VNRTLNDHQRLAEAQLRESLRSGHRRPIIQSPTGSGKTVLAAAIVEKALAKGKRVIFTVPKLSLIDQTVERFNEEGIKAIGVVQAITLTPMPHSRFRSVAFRPCDGGSCRRPTWF